MLDYYKYDEQGKMIHFDVERYLKDYKRNAAALKNIKAAHDDIESFMGSGLDIKVQSTPIGTGLDPIVMKRLHLEAQIVEYELYFKEYERALNTLPADESKCLRVFYQGAINPVQILIHELHVSERTVYRIKQKAVSDFATLLVGEI